MKKKLLLFVLVLSLILTPALSYAGSTQTLINANNEIGISYNLLSRYFTEVIGSDEITDSPGIGLSITALGNILTVPLVYEHIGYTNEYGKNTIIKTDILGMSARVGKAFIINQRTMIIPYLAYNYEKWDRNVSNAFVFGTEFFFNKLSYQDIYSYDALGVGVIGEYAITNTLVLKGRFQYSRMLNDNMTVYGAPTFFRFVISPTLPVLNVIAKLPPMSFNSENNPIYTIGAGVDYDIYGPLHIIAGIKYLRTSFGQTNINTSDINYSLGLAYSF